MNPNTKKRGTALFLIVAVLFVLYQCGTANPTTTVKDTVTNTADPSEKQNTPADGGSKEEAASEPKVETVYNHIKQGTNTLGMVWVDVLCVVKNTGSGTVYLDSGSVDIEDSNGKLVDTYDIIVPSPRVIAPGETAVYQKCFSIDNGIASETYSAKFQTEARNASIPHSRLPVHDFTLSENESGSLYMLGRVENTTSETVDPYVSVILYDSSDSVIGIFGTLEYDLKPNETKTFKSTRMEYSKIKLSDVARYEVIAYPYQTQW